MRKVVVLNSGGFDSTFLLHEVCHNVRQYDSVEESEIYSLFFSYGQSSRLREWECATKNARKLGIKHVDISLPRFDWTQSGFYRVHGAEESYLEWRNLVFLSYAASFSNGVGADTIYAAFIGLFEGDHFYYDDCKKFVRDYNRLVKPSGLVLSTPLIDFTKYDLYKFAIEYDIKPEDFISCDNVNHDTGEPCGVCTECVNTKYYTELYDEFNAER